MARGLLEPERITEHLYLIGGSELTDQRDCSVYLIDLGTLIVVDAGAGPSAGQIIRNIERAGYDPSLVSTLLLTHCHIDHVGGAGAIRSRLGTKIVMHGRDAEAVERGDKRMTAAFWYNVPFEPLPIDRKIERDKETLDFGDKRLLCLHTPGHTPGSMSLFIELDGHRILFGQDIHGPFFPEFGSDMTAWHASMKKLLSLNADILCEGHFGVYRSADRVKRYIEHYVAEHEGEG